MTATNWQKAFKAEVRLLSDQLRESLVKGEQRRTELGLSILRRLLREAPLFYKSVHDPASIGATTNYGHEWEQLIRCATSVQSTGRDTTVASVRHLLVVFLFDVLTDALEADELRAARDLSNLLEWTWADMTSGGGAWDIGDSEYFLTRLREVASWWPVDGAGSQSEHKVAAIYSGVFVKASKYAMDRSASPTPVMEIMEIFHDVSRHVRSNQERGAAYRKFYPASALILLGWHLFRLSRDGKSVETDDMGGRLLQLFSYDDAVWEGLECAHSDEFKWAVDWTWWEMPPSRGRAVGGVLQLGTYIDLAALLAMNNNLARLPTEATENDVSTARRLLALYKNLDEGKISVVSGIVSDTSMFTAAAKDQLKRIVEQDDTHQAEALARASLDPKRIEEFRGILVAEYGANPSLVDATLPIISDAPEDGARLLGFNRLQDKVWFVDSEAHLSPRMLGEDLARGIRAGENSLIAEVLLRGPVTNVDDVDSSFAAVKSWIQDHGGEEPLVLVTNSRDVVATFTDHRFRRPGDSKVQLDTTLGPSIYRIYSDDAPFVAVFAPRIGIRVNRYRLTVLRAGDVLVNDDTLLVGVDTPSGEEVSSWTSANPERSPIDFMGRVVVRVLISIDVSIASSSWVQTWRIPSGAA